MKKIYVILPLLALLAFTGVWWSYNSRYAEIQAAKEAKAQAAHLAKLEREAKDRQQAIDMAVAASDRRKAERLAKEARTEVERNARQDAIDALNRAATDKDKLSRQVDRLNKDIDNEKSQIADLQQDTKLAGEEEAFLRTYVTKAVANQQDLTNVLQQIAEADAAARAAAAQAAAAKKKS